MSGSVFAEAERPSASEAADSAAGEKRLTVFNGIALIVGLQIGSGIFSSPGVVVAHTHSARASLLIWVLGGLLSWTGASSFAELGAALPHNGGAQAYLAYTYGPLVSYLFTWTAILLLSPGTKAVISLVFAEYLHRVLWGATRGDELPGEVIPQWVITATAVAAVVGVVGLVVGTRGLGPRATVFLTSIKILALLSIILAGLTHLFLERDAPKPSPTPPPAQEAPPTIASYARALYAVLWAYDGFSQVNYVGGEMRNPERDIPRAIYLSMALVTVMFFLANAAYLSVLDPAALAHSNTVALDFGWALFGRAGGVFFALVVALSCLGAMTGSFFTSARVVYAAARTGQLPRFFGVLDAHRGTPVRAVLLQATFTIALVLLGGGFRALVSLAVVAFWAFYALTVLAVVILRVREPNLPRPYKTWIITPIIFCAVTLFLLCVPALSSPRDTLVVSCYVAVGVPAYYVTRKKTPAMGQPGSVQAYGST
ncbi:amino acid/polyamine transporter I [Gloeopeniophorella convolvens]|nr:amino acid/polyamine transporter I [Gloeopeniophorella convolvens]